MDPSSFKVIFIITILFNRSEVKLDQQNSMCPAFLLQYNGECYKRCPAGTRKIQETSECSFENSSHPDALSERFYTPKPKYQVKCPLNFCNGTRQYCYNIQCYESCPFHTLPAGNDCFEHCPQQKPYLSNGTCVSLCPEEKTVTEGNKCVESCSTSKFVFNFTCVDQCPNGHFIWNRHCITKCPENASYIFHRKSENYCQEICPEYTNVYMNYCKLECPSSKPYVLNRQCLSSCPADKPFIIIFTTEFNGGITCVSKCPKDTVLDGISCVDGCTTGQVLFNDSCIGNCPLSHQYLVHSTGANPLILGDKYVRNSRADIVCQQKCPVTYFEIHNNCYKECPEQLYEFNNSCVVECPNSHPLKNGRRCVISCQYLRIGNMCSFGTECPDGFKLLNRTCYQHCPDSHPFVQTKFINFWRNWPKYRTIKPKCVNKCPSYLVRHQNECVINCPKDSQVIAHGLCIEKCPNSVPFLQKSVQIYSNIPITWNKCIAKCSESFVEENGTCKRYCESSETLLNFNGKCVNYCPEVKPYIDIKTNKCVDTCPEYKQDNTSVDACPKNYVILNNTCLLQCPNSFPLLQNVTKEHMYWTKYRWKHINPVCVSDCPSYLVQYKNNCLKNCPNDEPFVINSTCRENCPISHLLLYTKVLNNPERKRTHCLKSSECHKLLQGNYCVDECPLRNVIVGSTCRLKCPQSLPYKLYLTKNVKTPKCSAKCPKTFVIDGNNCLNECPSQKKYLKGRQCKSKCPDALPIILEVTQNSINRVYRKCVSSCPPNMVIEKSYCRDSCSDKSKYRLLKYCYSKCPKDYPFHFSYTNAVSQKIQHTCVRHCPENSYLSNTSCALYCPLDQFGFNGKCIYSCPNSHPLNYTKDINGVLAYFCEKRCPNNTRKLGDQCFDHCPLPKKTFGETCLDKCPRTHKYANTQSVNGRYGVIYCLDKCANFTYKLECVSLCPKEEPFIFNGNCVQNCPKSKPLSRTDGVRHCFSSCPRDTAKLSETQCVTKCPDTMSFILKNSCIERCPSSHKYIEVTEIRNICRDQCEHYQVLNVKECVSTCPLNTFNVNNVCKNISRCPEMQPFTENRKQGRTCTSVCSDGNFLEEKHCQEGCSFGNVIFNKTCVRKCPQTHPYELYESAFNYSNKIFCHSSCPKGYVIEGPLCINETKCLKSGKMIDTGDCVNKCKHGHYLIESGLFYDHEVSNRCETKCPNGYYINGSRCMKCESLEAFEHNGQCLRSCPINTIPYINSNTYPKTQNCISTTGFYAGIVTMCIVLLIVGVLSWMIFYNNCIEKFSKWRHTNDEYADEDVDEDEFDDKDIDSYDFVDTDEESKSQDVNERCSDEETCLLKLEYREPSLSQESSCDGGATINHCDLDIVVHNSNNCRNEEGHLESLTLAKDVHSLSETEEILKDSTSLENTNNNIYQTGNISNKDVKNASKMFQTYCMDVSEVTAKHYSIANAYEDLNDPDSLCRSASCAITQKEFSDEEQETLLMSQFTSNNDNHDSITLLKVDENKF